MKDINVAVIVGRLTRDSEMRYTKDVKAVATFAIAFNGYKDEVSFIDCVLFGKIAESVSQYLKKGKQVCVEGAIKQNRWETDGKKHSKHEIVVNQIELLGGKVDESSDDDVPFY